MKKRIILLMILTILLNNCRSRTKITEIKKETEVEKIKVDSKIESNQEESSQKQTTKEKDSSVKNNQNSGEVEIKGNTDSLNNFNYYNVINGDTLQSIIINGNSNFSIRNKWNQEKRHETSVEKETDLNIVAKTAREAVSSTTIKEVAKEAKRINTKVKSTGFPFNVWLFAFLLVIVLILIWYFKKTISMYIPESIKKIFR